MSNLETVCKVWENPEIAYQDFLKREGTLTRKDYIQKIALIKDNVFNMNMLHGLLGNEVASYSAEEHYEMSALKDVITTVASYLLSGETIQLDNLSSIVDDAVHYHSGFLQGSSQSLGTKESIVYSMDDCCLIKNENSCNTLSDLISAGACDTAVYYDEDNLVCIATEDDTSPFYQYFADKRDKVIFQALYEAGAIPKTIFRSKIYDYLISWPEECETDEGICFVDASLFTLKNDTIIFEGREFHVDWDRRFNLSYTTGVMVDFEGTFAKERIVFLGV